MDDAESAEYERELAEEKARERAEAEKLVGVVLGGKYRIDAFVGGGAMGKVYRATQLLLDKVVAVKVLHVGLGQDEKFQSRFHREAKAASKMDHPNSVGVIDFGIERDGMMFIVMEFLAGRDLFTALRKEWPFSIERTVEVMAQVLSALAVAHEQGIVHRDLKPENVMLVPKKQDDGTMADIVKVADFGIAKIMDSHRSGATGERLSTAGNITGTPEYMSPEQAQARTIDGRADLYSCGVMLYEMCTGKLPFAAETPIGVVLKHITETPSDPRELNPALPEAMSALIMKSLSKSPGDRYSDARAMRAALRAVIGIRDVTTTSLSAEAIAAIAAIDGGESSQGLGQASTMVGVPAPAPVAATSATGPMAATPRLETASGVGAIRPAPSGAPVGTRTPSGPKGETTHPSTASVEVPVAQASPAPTTQPGGVSKGTLVASIVAAVSIGALAVVGLAKNNNQSASINAQAQAANQPPVAANNTIASNSNNVGPVGNPGAQNGANGAAQQPTQEPANTNAEPTANAAGTTPSPSNSGVETNPRAAGGTSTDNPGRPSRTQSAAAAQNTAARVNAANAGNTSAQATATNVAATTGTTQTPATSPPSAQTGAQGPTIQAQPTSTPPAVNTTAAQPTVTQPTVAPTVPPLTGVRASVAQLNASGGVLVNRLQGRAQTAADALARCALQQARAQRAEASFTSASDVTLNITVVDRRIDHARMLGGLAFVRGCVREAEPAFSGDLPEADDPEYTITLRVSLAPQR
jgi:serine/threonine protein kinase